MKPENLRVAIVYDWVNTPYGGAEQVLLAIHQVFPQADLITSVYDPQQAPWAQKFKTIKTTFLNRLPGAKRHHRFWSWLMPLAFETLNLRNYDLVISVTSSFAKGVITSTDTFHLCYLLTPPRFLYKPSHAYQQIYSWLKNPLLKFLTQPIYDYLQNWDQIAAFRPDITIPISNLVKQRAQQIYPQLKIENPIYPTIISPQNEAATNHLKFEFLQKQDINNFYLIVSRLVPYKKIELAIKACAQTDQKLVIVGTGPDQQRLQKLIASLNLTHQVLLLGNISQPQLQQLYQQARALLMPGEEDFGIVALEALQEGTPVVINQKSGAAELIKPGQTGLYIKKLSVSSLLAALQEVDKIKWQPAIMKKLVSKYQTTHFQQQLVEVITKHLS